VRVFGSTPDGQRVCLFVHGHFPYIFVPYSPPNKQDFDVEEVLTSILIFLNRALERMLTSNIRGILKSSGRSENEFELLPSGVVSVFYPSRPLIHSSLSPVISQIPSKSCIHYIPSGIHFPFVPSVTPKARSENPMVRKPYLQVGSDPRTYIKYLLLSCDYSC
jgi:hypothetical protein